MAEATRIILKQNIVDPYSQVCARHHCRQKKPFWGKGINRHTHRGSKLLCKFNMKDKTPFEEQYSLLYRAVCVIDNCTEDYVVETDTYSGKN